MSGSDNTGKVARGEVSNRKTLDRRGGRRDKDAGNRLGWPEIHDTPTDRTRAPRARRVRHRAPLVGLRQHRHPLRQVHAAGRGRDDRRKVQRCGTGPRADRGVSDGGAARALGPAGRRGRRRHPRAGAPARRAAGIDQPESLPGSALQVRLVRQSGRGSASAGAPACRRQRGDRHRAGVARHLAVVRRRLELSRHREHPPAARLVRRRVARQPRAADARPAPARRIQAVRAGVLPHRHRGLGDGAAAGARGGSGGAGAGRHRATTTSHRTSSRSSRGCWPRTCSAGFTSTIGGMPTTT